jgi:hypothetical protein
MRRAPNLQPRALAAPLVAAALACACGSTPDDSPSQPIQELLAGTWLREYQEHGTVVRRVLVLQPGGRFREMSTAQAGAEPPAGHLHEGEWVFDGTNLKRHYLRIDGQPPAAPMVPFATFEIRFATRNEFVGVDNIHKIEVRYGRVPEGTQP